MCSFVEFFHLRLRGPRGQKLSDGVNEAGPPSPVRWRRVREGRQRRSPFRNQPHTAFRLYACARKTGKLLSMPGSSFAKRVNSRRTPACLLILAVALKDKRAGRMESGEVRVAPRLAAEIDIKLGSRRGKALVGLFKAAFRFGLHRSRPSRRISCINGVLSR